MIRKKKQLSPSQIKALQSLSERRYKYIPYAIGRALEDAGFAESAHRVKSARWTKSGTITSMALFYRRTPEGGLFIESLKQES